MIDAAGPYLVDLRVPRDLSVFPMVAPGKGLADVVGVIDGATGKRDLGPVSDLEGGAR